MPTSLYSSSFVVNESESFIKCRSYSKPCTMQICQALFCQSGARVTCTAPSGAHCCKFSRAFFRACQQPHLSPRVPIPHTVLCVWNNDAYDCHRIFKHVQNPTTFSVSCTTSYPFHLHKKSVSLACRQHVCIQQNWPYISPSEVVTICDAVYFAT